MAKMQVTSNKVGTTVSKTVKEEYKQIMGPKVDYNKYFMSAPKAPTYYTPTTKSDSEILKEAQERYAGLYDAYIDSSKTQRDFNITSINQNIASLKDVYGQKSEILRESYKENEKNILNDAMSKGMGRSSYVIDSKRANNARMQRETGYLNAQKQREQAELERQIEQENLDYENAKNIYNAKRVAEVENLAAQMRKERDKSLFEAQKYNDDLYDNYRKLLLNQLKHNLNVQKYIDSLNTKKMTVSTSTKTTTSTTYKPVQGVDRDAVEALWSQMSGGQKIKYVQQNKSLLQQGAPDLYSKYLPEATAYGLSYALDKVKGIFS